MQIIYLAVSVKGKQRPDQKPHKTRNVPHRLLRQPNISTCFKKSFKNSSRYRLLNSLSLSLGDFIGADKTLKRI